MGAKPVLVALALGARLLLAQNACENTPAYSLCDLVFELTGEESIAHPNPYLTVELHAEFRSPQFRTFLLPAFWDGGRRMLIRFTPTEAGRWDYRLTSNLASLDGKAGWFNAAASDSPGFIFPRNVHHWSYTENNKPHLWMGDTSDRFAFLDDALFQRMVDTRAAQKFNHIRGLVLGSPEDAARIFPTPDQPDPAHFQRLDQRIRYMNSKGIIADLILASDRNHLARLFPQWQQRERYVRYLAARYAPMNITWQGVQAFETYDDGRALLKEIGLLLKKLDPYHHPMTTGALATSAPLLEDGWMNFVTYGSSDDQLGAIEHQLYALPFVNLNVADDNTGAFRRRLWNATMDGQYITYRGSESPDSASARQMTAWYDFFSGTRHWELEPYFDVDGGRCLALEGVEYIVYVEKPGPVELLVEKHGYDVAWVDPATGERTREKGYKGERFTGEPPDKTHDWVLHVSREGHKEGMRSYKFESRRIELQSIEQNPVKVPFEIEQPSQDSLSLAKPVAFAAHIKRETRATRSMLWLWTGEVAADGQGYRMLGTGPKGALQIPAGIAKNFPAVLNLRLYGMNANGKVYSLDKTYRLTQ